VGKHVDRLMEHAGQAAILAELAALRLDTQALRETVQREMGVAVVVKNDVDLRRERKALREHLRTFRARQNPNMARKGPRKKRRRA
jgi:hypothetical protein